MVKIRKSGAIVEVETTDNFFHTYPTYPARFAGVGQLHNGASMTPKCNERSWGFYRTLVPCQAIDFAVTS
jgi:hypothetical protein